MPFLFWNENYATMTQNASPCLVVVVVAVGGPCFLNLILLKGDLQKGKMQEYEQEAGLVCSAKTGININDRKSRFNSENVVRKICFLVTKATYDFVFQ